MGGGVEILGRLYSANESFRGQVRLVQLQDAVAEVCALPLCSQCRFVGTVWASHAGEHGGAANLQWLFRHAHDEDVLCTPVPVTHQTHHLFVHPLHCTKLQALQSNLHGAGCYTAIRAAVFPSVKRRHMSLAAATTQLLLTTLCGQVEAAGEGVEAELGAMLAATTSLWQESNPLPALRPVAVFDPVNNAVWLKVAARSQARTRAPWHVSPAYILLSEQAGCWAHSQPLPFVGRP